MVGQMKRPAGNKGPSAKKPKVDKVEVDPLVLQCQEAAKGLHEAEVADDVVAMLESMIQPALLTFKDERHKYQESVVDMVGEVLEGAESAMQSALEQTQAAIKASEAETEEKEKAVEAATAVQTAKEEVTQTEKRILAEVAKAFQACKSKVEEELAKQAGRIKELSKTETDMAQLQTAQAECVKPLTEGIEDAAQAKEVVNSLSEVLQKFAFDDSIIVALPNAGLKAPSARGPFDTMVLTQLNEEFQKRIATLDATLKAAEADKAADAADVQKAQDALESAKVEQQSKADLFLAAQSEQNVAEAANSEAKKALRAMGPRARKEANAMAAAERHLLVFREGSLAAFLALRDRVAPPPPVVEEESKEEQVETCGDAKEMQVEAPAEASMAE